MTKKLLVVAVVVISAYFTGEKMIEVLQFLFATEKDKLLYLNRESLIKELVDEYNFSEDEIRQAIEWFSPIATEQEFLSINPDSFRGVSDWEEQHLPKDIIKQILTLEQTNKINLVEREILFDRLGELCLDWQIDLEEVQEILDGLIYHIQNYKQNNTIDFDLPASKLLWAGNNTVH